VGDRTCGRDRRRGGIEKDVKVDHEKRGRPGQSDFFDALWGIAQVVTPWNARRRPLSLSWLERSSPARRGETEIGKGWTVDMLIALRATPQVPADLGRGATRARAAYSGQVGSRSASIASLRRIRPCGSTSRASLQAPAPQDFTVWAPPPRHRRRTSPAMSSAAG